MAVLQAYQEDLLKDLDQGQGLSPEVVTELNRTTVLTLRATKQTAAVIGCSMVAMEAMERHLNLVREKPVSPSELFGMSVDGSLKV